MKHKRFSGYNLDLAAQGEVLKNILLSSDVLRQALEEAERLGLAHYYIGAGCVAQTVWNHLSGKCLDFGIKDLDFAYYDPEHLSYEEEDEVCRQAKQLFSGLKVELDVKNQARVHLWYQSHFGYEIAPYPSLEAAVNTWPATATCVGVRLSADGEWRVYAPYGLNDLFGKIVRANKTQITREIYEKKTESWLKKWPDLTVIPWER